MFKLTQHSADQALILAIKKYLGHGNIYSLKSKDGGLAHVLVITKKSVILNKIIPLFNGNLFTIKKREQFKNWVNKYFPDIGKIDIDQPCPSPTWVTGFVDGDGSFCCLISKANSYKTGFRIQLVFEIAQISLETPILVL